MIAPSATATPLAAPPAVALSAADMRQTCNVTALYAARTHYHGQLQWARFGALQWVRFFDWSVGEK